MPAGLARAQGLCFQYNHFPSFMQRNSDIRLQQSLSTPSAANDPATLLNGGGTNAPGGGCRKDSEYRRFRSEGQFLGNGEGNGGLAENSRFWTALVTHSKGDQIGRRDLNEWNELGWLDG